jgi:hypothetical protein
MGLGSPLKGVTLAMARGLRDEVRAVMVRGGDPLEARQQSEQSASMNKRKYIFHHLES